MAQAKERRVDERVIRLLDRIHSPAELKKLSIDELASVAAEMRERIFSAVSTNGGHLASNRLVAVVGDASIVNGLAFEGLNGAGTVKRQLLLVLNDNGMSISNPQGAFAQYLERIRVSTTYEEFKRVSEKFVHCLPTNIGHAVEQAWNAICDGVKGVMWPGQIFESLGIKYMG